MGFEPMPSCLLDRRSNQLSYGALGLQLLHFLLMIDLQVKLYGPL